MTIRKGDSIIAGCLNNSYSAGDWIDIGQNGEISAKGDTNTNLGETEIVEVQLYAWSSSDTNFPTIYTKGIETINDLSYPYYDSSNNALSEQETVESGIFDFTYDFENAVPSLDPLKIEVTRSYEEFDMMNPDNVSTTTETIEYTRNSSLDTIYIESITVISSDDVLPTQKAVKTYVDNKASFTYDSSIQMMVIGGTE